MRLAKRLTTAVAKPCDERSPHRLQGSFMDEAAPALGELLRISAKRNYTYFCRQVDMALVVENSSDTLNKSFDRALRHQL